MLCIWFNLCLLSRIKLVLTVSADWSAPRRESLQSQWAEQIGDYLSGAEQAASRGSPGPWDPGHGGARAIRWPGPRPPVITSSSEIWFMTAVSPGRPMWAGTHNMTWTRPSGGGRGLWLNSSYSPHNELCQVCKTEIPHSPQGLSGVPNNWLVDNYGSYKDYPRFIWIKKGIFG